MVRKVGVGGAAAGVSRATLYLIKSAHIEEQAQLHLSRIRAIPRKRLASFALCQARQTSERASSLAQSIGVSVVRPLEFAPARCQSLPQKTGPRESRRLWQSPRPWYCQRPC